ncbi:MAG TPA: hypothetical protein VNA17_01585 [Pyrinomonadaceae bacterium]|nr:hypothetical protein [Pyrinomonadaceae bacterium]
MRAVEDLQVAAWGDAERDVVPMNQLVAARYVGGSLIGGFDHQTLAGFVYGFYGHIDGELVHHSHMLAVLPRWRGHDLGFRLKLAQREAVLADGFTNRITWTFDPLQSVNAHLNFTKLGVLSDTYKVNVYGDNSASFLHQNGTDRLFVTWLLDSPRVLDILKAPPQKPEEDQGEIVQLLRISASNSPVKGGPLDDLSRAASVSIEIPLDIDRIENNDSGRAREWREQTRYAFTRALDAGLVVADYRITVTKCGTYILRRGSLEDAAKSVHRRGD